MHDKTPEPYDRVYGPCERSLSSEEELFHRVESNDLVADACLLVDGEHGVGLEPDTHEPKLLDGLVSVSGMLAWEIDVDEDTDVCQSLADTFRALADELERRKAPTINVENQG